MSEPALIWDAMLNFTKVGLQLILDADMDLFFKRDMRGRVFLKKQILFQCQQMFADPHNIPFGAVTNLVSNFFD